MCLSGTLSNSFLRDEAASGFPKTTEEQKHSYKFPKKAARFVREPTRLVLVRPVHFRCDKFHGKRQIPWKAADPSVHSSRHNFCGRWQMNRHRWSASASSFHQSEAPNGDDGGMSQRRMGCSRKTEKSIPRVIPYKWLRLHSF